MASPLKGKHKVLIVTVKSADLKAKPKQANNAQTYACVYMNPEARICTKKIINTNSNPTWNQRFVFSISDYSLSQGNSSVCFHIHRARKGFFGIRDSLIGIAKGDVKSIMSNNGFDDDEDDAPLYDSDFMKFEDPRYPNMFAPWDDEEEKKEPYYTDIYCYNEKAKKRRVTKASACLEIVKGLEKKGELKVEMEVGETISCLANDFQWKNLAMPYEEFIMAELPSKNKNKVCSWMCFVSQSTQQNSSLS